jgi:hypothetical protein
MLFERNETPTIMDGLVVRWTCKTGWVNRPEISASRNGVCINGAWPTLSTAESIETVKSQLDEAYRVSRTMK